MEDPKAIAIAEVAKGVYTDAVGPSAREAGKLLALPWRVINQKLSPFYRKIYTSEQANEAFERRIAQHFAGRDETDIVEPPANIALPAIQGYIMTSDIPELQEMYLRLVATSMDAKTPDVAHPAYVDIVRQLTPDEARIVALFEKHWQIGSWQVEVEEHKFQPGGLGYIDRRVAFKRLTLIAKDARCDRPRAVAKYVDNLLRVHLLYETRKWPHSAVSVRQAQTPYPDMMNPDGPLQFVGGERFAEVVDQFPELRSLLVEIEPKNAEDGLNRLQIWRTDLRLTPFGEDFFNACLGAQLAPPPNDLSQTAIAEGLE